MLLWPSPSPDADGITSDQREKCVSLCEYCCSSNLQLLWWHVLHGSVSSGRPVVAQRQYKQLGGRTFNKSLRKTGGLVLNDWLLSLAISIFTERVLGRRWQSNSSAHPICFSKAPQGKHWHITMTDLGTTIGQCMSCLIRKVACCEWVSMTRR